MSLKYRYRCFVTGTIWVDGSLHTHGPNELARLPSAPPPGRLSESSWYWRFAFRARARFSLKLPFL